MMNKLEQLILQKLMKIYNKSQHSKLNRTSNRGVILDLKKVIDKTIYDPSDYESLCDMNNAIFALADKGLITYVKDNFNENYIAKVYLNLGRVDDISRITGIKNNKLELENILGIIEIISKSETNEWICLFLNNVVNAIINKNQLLLLPYNTDYIESIIKVLNVIAAEEGFYIRSLSTQLFSDSKYIERNILKYIIQILKQYHPDIIDRTDKDHISDNEMLRSVGLLTYEEVFEFTGECTAIYRNCVLDFSLYDNGMYIGSNIASQLSCFQLDQIRIVTLIENKTNYVRYCKEEKSRDELVIFSGGFYSIQRKRFYHILQKSMQCKQSVRLWSDIDLGGFIMFQKLKDVFHNLEPMRMDKESYNNSLEFARSMSDSYFQKILALKDQKEYEVFQDVIGEILKNKKVLEQESFYIELNTVF